MSAACPYILFCVQLTSAPVRNAQYVLILIHGNCKICVHLYINKQTCVELTETTLSTATTSQWLYTNIRCCTFVRSGVGGLGLASVVGGGGTMMQSPEVLRLPGTLCACCACARNRKRKAFVHVATGFGIRINWPDRSTHRACAKNWKRKSIVHVFT